MFPSEPSIALARERYQDLLREAEHERQLHALRPSARHWPGVADLWRTRRDALDRLRLLGCRAAPMPCPD